MSLTAYKVDAFTTTPYSGNIAGVVPDAAGLTDRQMQAIAREMNVSETAFVVRPTEPGAQMRLRFFTPTTEIRLCGHATIASFHLLVEKGILKAPTRVALQTNVGILDVEVRADGSVYLSSDALTVAPAPFDRAQCAKLLGIPAEDVRDGALIIRRTLFVFVSGLKAMEAMRPDVQALLAEGGRFDGIVPVSLETGSPEALTRIRFFAPALGIAEDPVTGTAHMALAAFLVHHGKLASPGKFTGEQGNECGRPGKVFVEFEGAPGALSAKAGGFAVTVLEGTMALP